MLFMVTKKTRILLLARQRDLAYSRIPISSSITCAAERTYFNYTHGLRIMAPKAKPEAEPAQTSKYDSDSEDDASIARLEANTEEFRAISREREEILQKMTALIRRQQDLRQRQAAPGLDPAEGDQEIAACARQMEREGESQI